MNEIEVLLNRTLNDVRLALSGRACDYDAIAKKAKITTRTIYNILQPSYKPSLKTLYDLQKAIVSVKPKVKK